MPLHRRSVTASFSTFGRRARSAFRRDAPRSANALSEEARLFALTFVGGFLFMAVYLA